MSDLLLANPCCGCGNKIQPSCGYDFEGDLLRFWHFKERNYPDSTPVFNAEWDFIGGHVRLENKGSFTLVYDTEFNPAEIGRLEVEAHFRKDSLVGEAGVSFRLPDDEESISVWWLGGLDFELRKGDTVLAAFQSDPDPWESEVLPGGNLFIIFKLVLVTPKASATNVEVYVWDTLAHTQTNVPWIMPELLDYGAVVDGEARLRHVWASPCGISCEIEGECGSDIEAPEIWTLNVPTIIPKANPDALGRWVPCQSSVNEFFSGGHTLVRKHDGRVQGLIRVEPQGDILPQEYAWVDCPDITFPYTPCEWVAVTTSSQSLGVSPYICSNPKIQMPGFPDEGKLVCNRTVINNRDINKFPIRSKGACYVHPYQHGPYGEQEFDEWLGPTSFGDCSQNPTGGNFYEGSGYPNAETWTIRVRNTSEVPEWQWQQEDWPLPMGSLQVTATANFWFNFKDANGGWFPFPQFLYMGINYYSEWFSASNPIPSSAPVTLQREDLRYTEGPPIPTAFNWWEFPETIQANPNGVGDDDAYTRFCRGLNCQPILDPEEDTEYTFTMTYELPDESLLVDEPTLTAYFQEDDDSWEWFGPGGPISLDDCPGLGSFYYHIHCVKEANSGRGQWVLDITNASSTRSRLNMVVDEELGITFEGTVISGCDGQIWDGIVDELRTATLPDRWGSCLPNKRISATIEINCFYTPGFERDQVNLRTWDTGWMVSYESTIVRAGNFQIDGKHFAIAVWPLDATSYRVEIRQGPLMRRGPGGILGLNWHSLPYIMHTGGSYICHPDYGYPIMTPVFMPYSFGGIGDTNVHDPFEMCPDVPGGGGGEVYIAWN